MKYNFFKSVVSAICITGALVAATSASAITTNTYGFTRITDNNNLVDPASQFKVEVSDAAGAGFVQFKFLNNVGIASSITEIYFDDGFFGAPALAMSSGVTFVTGADPANLPSQGSATPPFVTSVAFSAQSDGATANGVNALGEWVILTFALGNYADYAAVIAALDNPTSDGVGEGYSLRIGLHVRSIGTVGGSDAFVNVPGVPSVPDGGSTAAMLGLGLLGADYFRRRFVRA